MLQDMERWRITYGARFETSKYISIHFTRRSQSTQASITINNETIEPSNEAKYFGVILDHKLSFKQHLQYVTKKGTKFALAMARITKETWGAPFQRLRQLFTTVVASRMDYTAVAFYRPAKSGCLVSILKLDKLISAQRTAMKVMLGCYYTTSTGLEIGQENPVPNSVSYSYFRYYIESIQDYHFLATDHA